MVNEYLNFSVDGRIEQLKTKQLLQWHDLAWFCSVKIRWIFWHHHSLLPHQMVIKNLHSTSSLFPSIACYSVFSRHFEILEAMEIISERFDILEDKIDILRDEIRGKKRINNLKETPQHPGRINVSTIRQRMRLLWRSFLLWIIHILHEKE